MAWGIDNGIKTPYSYALDFSLQRELPGGFVAEADYVGRLGRHLLQHLDLATPVNLVDKQSGVDYFTAGAEMSKISDQNGGNANATVAPISYFENMFPYMAGGGESATQNIYTQLWAPLRYSYGETTSLFILDFGDPNGLRYWSPQYSALYGWSSIGTSSYNALQIIVRHPSKHGLTTDFNFTYSKSLDMGSSAERAIMLGTNDAFADNSITNAWNPKQEKGPSDFDTRFLATIDWVYSLPVGRGKAALGNANRAVDALVGGWQWAGLSRWSSGLPFSVFEAGFTTDWQEQSYGIVTSPVHTQRHLVNGIPQVFAGNSATTINNGVYSGSPIRIPYPGEAGQRNNFRGDGYFDIDSSLAKTWDLHDTLKLKFIGEVYNVPNNVRFDVSPINLNASLSSGTFGAYGGMLSTYRRMEFGLRLEF
jgi:hypothetical protein